MKKEYVLKADPERPSLSVLVKLGSLAVHTEEFFSKGSGYHCGFDESAIRALLVDPELEAWIRSMGGLLPVKR